jgi:biopolymer transport protein ExbB
MNLLFAQTAEKAWYETGALGYMIDGGIFMWPILIMGILAAAVMIERYRSLKMLTGDTRALRERVLELLQAGRTEEALELCQREQGPVPAVLSAGLRKYLVLQRLGYDPAGIEQQVVKAMEDYAVHIVAALEKHLPILGTIASVAPMVGFLGTVQGMIISFGEVVRSNSSSIVKDAAGGIMVALLTTAFGLIVGIPAFTAYNYFTGLINRYVLEVEETASELIEAVTLQTTLQQQKNAPAEPVTQAS